mgnify:FL=1
MQIGNLIRIKIIDEWHLAFIGQVGNGLLRVYWFDDMLSPSWFFHARLKRLIEYGEVEILCT